MGTLPLHPALVHLPIGLAFVIPLLALALTVALWRGALPGRSWGLLVGLQALVLAGGIAARTTGEAEEEKVENVVAESRIEAHEEAANQFMIATVLVLLLSGAGLFVSEERKRYVGVAVTVGSLAVAGLAVKVGHAGGELVYTYGAASAYTTQAGAGAGEGSAARADSDRPRYPPGSGPGTGCRSRRLPD